jgi:tetratricopeptide (TPR) repeat protein/serine/threonine protein kinase
MVQAPADEADIFQIAREIATPEARAAYLQQACGDDAALRERVLALLQIAEEQQSFLEQPPAAYAQTVTPQLLAESPGTVIGPYKLLEQIGEGGFGVVFMAEQTAPVRRKVALKVIKPGMDTRQVIARFEAERQALALMDHPNIARVLDAGATDTGRPFFVMELVKGVPITDYCDQHQLTPKQRLELFVTVCQGVQHAHQKGIIHRDIKPSNVLVTLHDDKPVVKVIDFGIAKATSGQLTDKTLFTGFAQLIGTPLYMSPEQAAMSGLDVDTRSDIYSLGVLLYELLTGTTPFDRTRLQAAAFDEVRRIIREEEPAKPSTRLSELSRSGLPGRTGGKTGASAHSGPARQAGPTSLASIAALRKTEPRKLSQLVRGDLDWIVMKALEKDRARRYETANGFAADVLHYLADEPVTACPPSAAYRFRKFARRNRPILTMSSVIALILLLAVGSIGWMVRDRGVREQQAARERVDRRDRLTGRVTSILEEVRRLEVEESWPEALAAAQRAQALAEAEEVDPDVAEQVRQVLQELQFVQRLDDVRLERADAQNGKFDNAGTVAAYARVFRDFGVDLEQLPTDQAVSRLKRHSQVVLPLARAIDDFSSTRRAAAGWSDQTWRSLLSVARQLDPDETRDQLRVLYGQETSSELRTKLQALAESIEVPRQPPVTLRMLSLLLGRAGLTELSQTLFQQAQQQYPDDFWINFDLARSLAESNDLEGAVRFFSVAVALRPTATVALNHLGATLNKQHKTHDAEACFRRAVLIEPAYVHAWANLGVVLLDQRQLDEAAVSCRHATEADPTYARVWSILADVLIRQKKLDDAEVCCRRAIELDADAASSHLSLGNLYYYRWRLDEAEACYRRAIELDPNNANAHVCLGTVLKNRQGMDEAEGRYRRAIELDPVNSYAWGGLGSVLCLQHKLDEAEVCSRRAIELDPAVNGGYHSLGIVLGDRGKLDEAEDCLRKAIELEPTDPFALHDLANILVDQKKLGEAVTVYRRALELNPRLVRTWSCLGRLLNNQKRWDEAEECYRHTRELAPLEAWVHGDLGTVLWRKGQLQEAEECARRAIELDPMLAAAHSNLGLVLNDQRRPQEAEACCRRAVELNPLRANFHNNLGLALRDQGKFDEAEACFRRTLELDPLHVNALINLGDVLRGRGELHEAEACYRRGIEIDPMRVYFYDALGRMLRDQGKLDDAETLCRRGIELDGAYVHNWYTLGSVLLDQNRLDEAESCYRRAVELNPEEFYGYFTLGGILLDQGKPADAVVVLKKAVEFHPDGEWSRFRLGIAQYRTGNWEESVTELEKACEFDTETNGQGRAQQWLFLAMAHWQLGHPQEARKWYDKAIEHEKAWPDELRGYRDEAAKLLRIPDPTPLEQPPDDKPDT